MACERDRILKINEYLSSLGIKVNIGKNKARGHKGFFMHRFDNYRIDISKNLDDKAILSVILHEFAHFIHYSYDKTLLDLNFIFNNYSDDIREELINITIQDVPKDFAASLYNQKDQLNKELKILIDKIKQSYPHFKLSEKNKNIEKNIPFPLNFLLKYDNVKHFNNLYSISALEQTNLNEEAKIYIKIRFIQRNIKRINARINKLNKYYNTPTELFARFIDSYYTKPEYTKRLAPIACSCIKKSDNPYFENLNRIFS